MLPLLLAVTYAVSHCFLYFQCTDLTVPESGPFLLGETLHCIARSGPTCPVIADTPWQISGLNPGESIMNNGGDGTLLALVLQLLSQRRCYSACP